MEILIVDDERDLLESLRRGLLSLQYQTREVMSAGDAMEVIQSSAAIDLVLTDYAMPGMTGMELVDWIRKEKEDLPVIVMTAYGDKDLVIRALRNHCSGYIEKPFTLLQLVDEIKRVTAHQQSKSALFSNTFCRLAHQINNPLMAIVGSAELSLEEETDNISPDSQERLQNIIAAAQRINTINRQIMGLGKIMVEQPEPVNVGNLMRQCLKMNADLMKIKEIKLKWENEGQDCIAMGTDFALEQVFKNILLNAIEAMDDCTDRTVKVGILHQPSSDQVAISIEDTGNGVPPDKLEQIFDPYYTSKPNGNGIGLAVVKSIVDQFRGMVKVDSWQGLGTRFTVLLPSN